MTGGGAAVSEDQKSYLSPQWHDRLSRMISRGKKAAALAFLEQTIERSLPLFRADRAIFESRRTAWLVQRTEAHAVFTGPQLPPKLRLSPYPGAARQRHRHRAPSNGCHSLF